MNFTPAERRLRKLLRFLLGAFLLAMVVYEAGAFIEPFKNFYKQLPFVSNSVVKVGILMLLCLYASGNVRERMGLVAILIYAHLISIAAMLVFILRANAAGEIVSIGLWELPASSILWGAIALDSLITLTIAIFYFDARKSIKALNLPQGRPQKYLLAGAERWMKGALIFFGGIFSLAAIGYEAGAFFSATESFFIQLPFVSNSVVKVSALAMLCFFAAGNFRKNLSLAGIIIAAHGISIAAMLGLLLGADTSYAVQIANNTLSIKSVLWNAIALDGGITLFLIILYHLVSSCLESAFPTGIFSSHSLPLAYGACGSGGAWGR